MKKTRRKLMAALLVLALILCGKTWANPTEAQAAKKVVYYDATSINMYQTAKEKRQAKKDHRKWKVGLITKVVKKKNKLIIYGSFERYNNKNYEKGSYLKYKKRVFKMAKNVKYYIPDMYKISKKEGVKRILTGNYMAVNLKIVNGKVTQIYYHS